MPTLRPGLRSLTDDGSKPNLQLVSVVNITTSDALNENWFNRFIDPLSFSLQSKTVWEVIGLSPENVEYQFIKFVISTTCAYCLGIKGLASLA